MRLPSCLALGVLLCGLCCAAFGQAGTAPAALLPPPPGLAASAPAQAASAAARTTVIEDSDVRIEETRVRGQLQRVVVKSKLPGVKPYEIQVGAGGRDPSQGHGAAGRRTWSVLDF